MYIEVLDVSVFSVFKNHYYEYSKVYIEKAGRRSKIKLTGSHSKIFCTRLTWTAWKRTIVAIDISQSSRKIGYTWTDDDATPVKRHKYQRNK